MLPQKSKNKQYDKGSVYFNALPYIFAPLLVNYL